MSLIGKEVVEFSADAFRNGEFVTVTNEDLKGKWSVVMFYPADFTFVCPTELEDMQNAYESKLKDMGVEVYAVSTDTHFTHKAWHDSSEAIGKVTYTMIGDPAHVLAKGFDVLIEGVGLADRGTFIVDPDGVIQGVEVTAGGMGRDAQSTVDKVRAAQYMREHPGEVCPAKWKENGETLKPSLDLVGKI
jgi:peroxiredoxin (alkyl hydroperoxide reductase subunit C)